MNTKRTLAAIFAVSMMCTAVAGCGSKSSSSSKTSSSSAVVTTEAPKEETETTTEAPTAAPIEVEVEDSIAAQSGEAYLAINDAQGWCQYFGKNDDPKHTMLSYDAGVAPIKGNGSYKVSVTADTNGFRLDTTGDANDNSVIPAGLMFSAVIIKDGNTLFPGAVITIDSIKVDGKDVKLTNKNYTSSDDGVELRTNILNEWVDALPKDAVSVDGALVDEDGNAKDAANDYSPVIVDKSDFSSWTTVEVEFTVSGLE